MNPALELRVHDLKQWAYCPRIVFYNHVMPVDINPTFKMKHGHSAEDAFDALERRRKLTEFGLKDGKRHFHYWCKSEKLGLSGKLDLLIESGTDLYPVDFKETEQQIHPNHVMQLCGYALLLEEHFERPVTKGFIFLIPRDEVVPVDLTDERKDAARVAVNQIRQAINEQRTPGPTEVVARCNDCEYRNYCGDVF